MKDKIVKNHQFKHPIDKVWKAITEAEEISTWFLQTDFKAEQGYQYTFSHEGDDGDCTTINGEVLKVNPKTVLVYTWIVEGTNVETTVSWKLKANQEGTALVLEHSGIANYPDNETAVAMFKSFSSGWDNCVKDLDNHLTTVNA